MIHGQDDEAARKSEEFQNQPAGGETQQKGGCSESVRDEGARSLIGAVLRFTDLSGQMKLPRTRLGPHKRARLRFEP